MPELVLYVSMHVRKIYSRRNIVGPHTVSVARPEGEVRSNKSALELDFSTNSKAIKIMTELSNNVTIINRRLDLIESKFDK